MNNRIYEIWKYIGRRLNVLKHHNIIVGKTWLKTRQVLEDSYDKTLERYDIDEINLK